MRATTLAAGGLACAGAAMTIAAFAGGGSDPPAAGRPAAAHDGLSVWVAQGCGSCHTFAPANARGGLGPDLALSLHGRDADSVLQSIVAPNAVIAPGWGGDMMPGDFAQRIATEDLHPLVAYLMKGAS